MSATTVHNVLLPITYVSADTSFRQIYALFSSLCTTPYRPLALVHVSLSMSPSMTY